ncbi:MAG: hypothetical protein ACI8WM_002057 [Burkholderiaceae bacterium]
MCVNNSESLLSGSLIKIRVVCIKFKRLEYCNAIGMPSKKQENRRFFRALMNVVVRRRPSWCVASGAAIAIAVMP